jgi:hypothetical protein
MGGPNFDATVSGSGDPGVRGISPNGNGVVGRSGPALSGVPNGFGVVGIGGVHGSNDDGPGVQGRSSSGIGVDGRSMGDRPGVRGRSETGPGVEGQTSGADPENPAPGVLGGDPGPGTPDRQRGSSNFRGGRSRSCG